jgi:hypothetical protein
MIGIRIRAGSRNKSTGKLVVGEGYVEFGADLPTVFRVVPHGHVGAGVGGVASGVGGDPVALFGGLGFGGGQLDGVGDALVAEGSFGIVEILLEEFEVDSAGGDEGAIADDGAEVFGEGVAHAEEVTAGDGALASSCAGSVVMGLL